MGYQPAEGVPGVGPMQSELAIRWGVAIPIRVGKRCREPPADPRARPQSGSTPGTLSIGRGTQILKLFARRDSIFRSYDQGRLEATVSVKSTQVPGFPATRDSESRSDDMRGQLIPPLRGSTGVLPDSLGLASQAIHMPPLRGSGVCITRGIIAPGNVIDRNSLAEGHIQKNTMCHPLPPSPNTV